MVEYFLKKYEDDKRNISRFIVENRHGNTGELVNWRYSKLTDIDDINAIAMDKGEIIGLESLFIRKMIINGVEFFFADSGHAQVNEAYAGQGMFSRLLLNASEKAEGANIHSLFCIPTKESMNIYSRQKWQHIGDILKYYKRLDIYQKLYSIFPVRYFCKVINAIYLLIINIFSIFSFVNIKKYRFYEVSDLDDKYSRLCKKLSNEFPLMRLRDSTFLNWRFRIKPDNESDYKICELSFGNELRGYVVLQFHEKSNLVTIIDFLVDEKDMAVLIKMTINYIKSLKKYYISNLNIGVSDNHKIIKYLRFIGFKKEKFELPVIIKINNEKTADPSFFFYKIKNWHITLADKDTL
jgi:hypothetical protein